MKMPQGTTESRVDTLRLIAADAERDAHSLDGLPLDGPTMGKRLGEIYAMIASTAAIVANEIEGRE